MKTTAAVATGALVVLGTLAACSSAPPPKAAQPEQAAAAAAAPGESPAEAFERVCGASSRLPRLLEKPLPSMGRTPRLAALVDDGLLVAGEREADAVATTPTRSVAVVRLADDGRVVWEISLVHPAGRLAALAVAETPDGGFAVLGRTELTREPRAYGWLTKLSADGAILWRDFFDATSGMDAGKADRFLPQLKDYAFDRLAVSESGKLVVAGAGANGATAEIDLIGALGKVTPGDAGAPAAEPTAALLDGGTAVITAVRSEPLDRACFKLRVLDESGNAVAEEPLVSEARAGDRPAVAAVGASRVAVAVADVGALVVVVFATER